MGRPALLFTSRRDISHPLDSNSFLLLYSITCNYFTKTNLKERKKQTMPLIISSAFQECGQCIILIFLTHYIG